MIVIIKKSNYTNFKKLGNIYIVSYDAVNYLDNLVTCTQITVKLNSRMSYEEIVSKLIRARYTTDKEFSLINNALADITNISSNEEYKEYQEWRTKCKEVAKNYINGNEEIN